MIPVRVDDPDDPRLADYRALEALAHRSDPHRFVAESELVVERLLRSDYGVASVLTTASHCERLAPILAARPEVPVYVGEQAVLRQAVGQNFHRGVAACGLRPAGLRWNDMSPETDRQPVLEDTLLEDVAGRPAYTVLLAQGLADPANVGAIVRAARAFGVDLLLLDRAGADPLSRRAIRAAAGNVFAQATLGVGDLVGAVQRLRGAGATVLAATPGPRARPLGAVVRPARLVILVGSEGQGLPAALRAVGDDEVAIPMRPGVDSLGVAAATAILLYALAGAHGPGL
ncbi:TrmH family RNA methyltransferase [Nannocystis bainbridge]|uniref:RNA methyltransferase n=1 Tax=Nannocystis bainbridge TaxID=2995303 RepID=A0ABT5DYN7_9BACT|nr:RNA methyltransferase [Nannocystis bainbridge]MDC0718258.1 RNA methyltransferase [Nannocystis bainbridge]